MKILLKLLNTVLFTIMIIVNYLATKGEINHIKTGDISDQFPLLITPAGYVFSIWGIIYIGIFCWIIYEWLSKKTFSTTKEVGMFIPLNFILNISWLIAWHYQCYWLSLSIMISLLLTLIIIFIKHDTSHPLHSVWSIYLGWISVATLVNLTQSLSLIWSNVGMNLIWSITMLLIGMIASLYMSQKKNNLWHGVVFLWAIVGIFMKDESLELWKSCLVGIFILTCIGLFYRKKGLWEK